MKVFVLKSISVCWVSVTNTSQVVKLVVVFESENIAK